MKAFPVPIADSSFTPTGQASITAGVATANVALGSSISSAASWVGNTTYTLSLIHI